MTAENITNKSFWEVWSLVKSNDPLGRNCKPHAMKMEVTGLSENLVIIYQTTRRYVPEDLSLLYKNISSKTWKFSAIYGNVWLVDTIPNCIKLPSSKPPSINLSELSYWQGL
jgi:hypothetical protein